MTPVAIYQAAGTTAHLLGMFHTTTIRDVLEWLETYRYITDRNSYSARYIDEDNTALHFQGERDASFVVRNIPAVVDSPKPGW